MTTTKQTTLTDIPTVRMSEIVPLIVRLYKSGVRAVMIHGAPGVGKTRLPEQVAAELGLPFKMWRCGTKSLGDISVPVANHESKRTEWYMPSAHDIPDAELDGPDGVWGLDEITNTPKALQGPMLSLVEDNVLGEHVVPDWLMIATGNRVFDGALATQLATALDDRFFHFNVEPDVESVIEFADRVGLENADILTGFLRFRPALLHVMPGNTATDEQTDWRIAIEAKAHAFPTPRSWFKVAPLFKLPVQVREKSIAAKIGCGPAAELEAYLRIGMGNMPTKEQVEKDPKSAPMPEGAAADAGARYAIAVALARWADVSNIEAMLTYAARMGAEFEQMVLADARRKDAALAETKAYVDRSIASQDIRF